MQNQNPNQPKVEGINQKGNIGVIISFVIVVGLIGAVVYLLMNQSIKVDPLEGINKVGDVKLETSTKQNPEQKQEQSLNTNKKMEPNTPTRLLKDFIPVSSISKLEKIDKVIGTGAEAKITDTVSVQYTGAVASTGVIFQSSKDFGTDPVTFPLNQVIKGWTNGIPGMKIGGTRRLVIPAAMAYASTPPPGSGIPANADLVFDVELVAIK